MPTPSGTLLCPLNLGLSPTSSMLAPSGPAVCLTDLPSGTFPTSSLPYRPTIWDFPNQHQTYHLGLSQPAADLPSGTFPTSSRPIPSGTFPTSNLPYRPTIWDFPNQQSASDPTIWDFPNQLLVYTFKGVQTLPNLSAFLTLIC